MKKDIKKKRIKKYFIDACRQIIAEDGLEGVTTRKVADLAGYNSATLYNYFDNLDHLKLYASFKYLNGYLQRLRSEELPEHPAKRFKTVWRLFAEEAFKHPQFYYYMFFKFDDANSNDAMRDYFNLYPAEVSGLPEALIPMILESSITIRDHENLDACVKEGLICKAHVPVITDMLALILQSMLLQAMANPSEPYEARAMKIADYANHLLEVHLIKS